MPDSQSIKAIIFDFDGVLMDTEPLHWESWKRLAAKYAWRVDLSVSNNMRGKNRVQSLETLLAHNPQVAYSVEEKEAFCAEKQQVYLALVDELVANTDFGATGLLLQALKQAGYKLALASSSKNAAYLLEKIGLAAFFDQIVDGNAGLPSKPQPDMFSFCSQQLEVAPQNCLVVEDSASGIAAAKNAGMEYLHFLYGNQLRENLMEALGFTETIR